MSRKITMIVAYGPDGVMGRSGGLPWPHHAEDMQRFRRETLGQAVIMGRKTWESLGGKGLDFRHNIVITSQRNAIDRSLADPVKNLDEAIRAAGQARPYIIGGAKTFAASLPYVNRYLITEMVKSWPGDVYFKVPFLSSKVLVSKEEWVDNDPDLNCTFSEYADV